MIISWSFHTLIISWSFHTLIISQSFHTLIISWLFSACGGLYQSNMGILSSPNYPSNYPANTECVWDINVLIGYTVKLTVAANFNLQSSPGCTRDYVEVSPCILSATMWCDCSCCLEPYFKHPRLRHRKKAEARVHAEIEV